MDFVFSSKVLYTWNDYNKNCEQIFIEKNVFFSLVFFKENDHTSSIMGKNSLAGWHRTDCLLLWKIQEVEVEKSEAATGENTVKIVKLESFLHFYISGF